MTPFTPTYEQRQECEILLASGWSQADIAAYLQIDEKTLRKAFRDELDHGYLRRRAEITVHFYRCAAGGSGSAAKHWLAIYGAKTEPQPAPEGVN